MIDHILALVVNILVWVYVIYCLLGGKKIEYECKSGSKAVIIGLFLLLGLLMWYRLNDIYGALTLASFLLAGGVYQVIPSGFSKDAVIVMGRRYPFDKISEMELRIEGDRLLLSFRFKGKIHLLFGELSQKDFMKAYFDLYQKTSSASMHR